MSQLNDGWDDDELSVGWVEDGWGDDELDILNEDHGGGSDEELAALNRESSGSDGISIDVDEGWDWNDDHVDNGDDDNGNDNHSDEAVLSVGNEPAHQHQHQHPQPPKPPAPPPQKNRQQHPQSAMMQQKLLEYMEELQDTSLTRAINDELDLKHNNNPEKALDLCRYYHERENLRAYTLDAEVPRMDYQIMISDALILTEAQEIQYHFLHHPVDNLADDMLLRASNQSILADVFPIMTGPDKVIRMQFGANAVAEKCRLVLDMRGMRTLQVECEITISVPSGIGVRVQGSGAPTSTPNAKLDLASLRLLVNFSPEPSAPFIKYQLVSIKPLLNIHKDADREKIRIASNAMDYNEVMEQIAMMKEHEMAMVQPEFSANVRDNFLNSLIATHTQNTAEGFKSAWRDIDHVVNVSSKLNLLKKAMPVLPSTDDILSAEYEEEHEHEHTSGTLKFPRPRDTPPITAAPVPNSFQQQVLPPPPPPNQAMQRESSASSSGGPPKPLIGGMLMSGITRLAKAAASHPEHQQSAIPTLYRKEIPPAPVPVPPPPPPPAHPSETDGQSVTKSAVMATNVNAPAKDSSTRATVGGASTSTSRSFHLSSSAALNDAVDDDLNDDDDLSTGGWSDDGLDADLSEDGELDAALNDMSIVNNNNKVDTGVSAVPFPAPTTTAISNRSELSNDIHGDDANAIIEQASVPPPTFHQKPPNMTESGLRFNVDRNEYKFEAADLNNNLMKENQSEENDGEQIPSEIEAERKYLLEKLAMIRNTKVKHFGLTSRDDGDTAEESEFDASSGIIPTRKRFVSRSELLNLRTSSSHHQIHTQ